MAISHLKYRESITHRKIVTEFNALDCSKYFYWSAGGAELILKKKVRLGTFCSKFSFEFDVHITVFAFPTGGDLFIRQDSQLHIYWLRSVNRSEKAAVHQGKEFQFEVIMESLHF